MCASLMKYVTGHFPATMENRTRFRGFITSMKCNPVLRVDLGLVNAGMLSWSQPARIAATSLVPLLISPTQNKQTTFPPQGRLDTPHQGCQKKGLIDLQLLCPEWDNSLSLLCAGR